MPATNSDVSAKQAYMAVLRSNGGEDVRVVSSPCDILATFDGTQHYYEIKSTAKTENYFGSASVVEWEAAIKNPDTYFFVVCVCVNNKWVFTKYTPSEFIEFSTVPPARTYFYITSTLSKVETGIKEETTSVRLTEDRIHELCELNRRYRLE